MPFKKGKSGNPHGRPENAKPVTQMLTSALNEAHESGSKTKMRAVIDAWIAAALAGELPAIFAIADRLDGKPAQESTVTVRSELDSMTDAELREFIRRELAASSDCGAEASQQPDSQLTH